MKIFSVKRMLGLAAIGGAIAYARKHGGFKQAFNDLMAKKDDLLRQVKDKNVDASKRSPYAGSADEVGYSGSGGGLGYERH
jgi:hypothetical protein